MELTPAALMAWALKTRRLVRAPIWLARACFLSDEESAAALVRYEKTHPQAFKQLRATIEQATGAPVANLPTVELELT